MNLKNQDICWIQRFGNFKKALKQLDNAMTLMAERDLSELEKQGVSFKLLSITLN